MIAPDYKLDITYYHASSLYKYQDQTQALEDGLIDMGTFIVTYELARAPLHEVVTLPPLYRNRYGRPRHEQDLV